MTWKKRNLLKRKSWINIRRCAHLAFHLSTQTRGKTTQSVNYTTVTYTIKNTFIFRKNDFIRSLEKDWYQYKSDTTWWENICYFQDNWKWSTAKHTEKTEIRFKIVKLARPFGKKKISMFRDTLIRIYFSSKFRFGHEIFAFWETYRWTSRAFWTYNTTCNQKYCCQQEPLDCLHLMLRRGNWVLTCLCDSEEI